MSVFVKITVFEGQISISKDGRTATQVPLILSFISYTVFTFLGPYPQNHHNSSEGIEKTIKPSMGNRTHGPQITGQTP